MSLKTYVPSGIEAEVERVKNGESKSSPSYFTTSLVRPTALSRNLKEIVRASDYLFTVVPLALPSTHSSGNPSNSRAFDYDYLVANDSNTDINHFFVMDTGSKTWFLTFEEELSKTSYKFKAIELYENEPNLNFYLSDFKLMSTSNIVSNIASVVDNSTVKGYCIDYTDIDYEIFITEDTVEEEVLEDGETVMTRTVYLTIETERELSSAERQVLKDINVITAFSRDTYQTNIRFFNKLTFSSTLNDYYIYNNSTVIENLRDFLVSKGVGAHAAFAGSVGDNEGLMFNVESRFTDESDFTSSISSLKSDLGTSAVIMSNGDRSFVGSNSLCFKAKDDDVSTILEVKLLKVTEDAETGDEIVTTIKSQSSSLDPLVWSEFFKDYGITATTINKRIVKTRTETVTTPSTEPDGEPTITEKTIEEVSYLFKGLVLLQTKSLDTEDVTYLVKFKTNGDSTATVGCEETLTCFSGVFSTSGKDVLVYPTEESLDGLEKTFTLGYKSALNTFTNMFEIGIKDLKETFTVKSANATNLAVTEYSLSQPLNVTSNVTPFFNKGYGVNSSIQSLKTFISNIGGYSVLSNDNFANVIVKNTTSSIKKLYLQTDKEGKLSTDTVGALSTKSETILQTNGSVQETLEFPSIMTLPYVVVDMYNMEKLSINPFSYLKLDGTLISEQDVSVVDTGLLVLPEDSAEKSAMFKTLAKTLSTSNVSINFLPIVPLLEEDDTFSECFAIFYDPSVVEGKALTNAFVSLERSAILKSTSSTPLKYKAGYENTVPFYKNVSFTSPELIVDAQVNEHFKIKDSTVANIYSTSISYSFNDDFDVTLEVIDYLGTSLKSVRLQSIGDTSLDEQLNAFNGILKVTSETASIKKISLDSDLSGSRYSLKITNSLGGDIVNSKCVHELTPNVVLIPMNKV